MRYIAVITLLILIGAIAKAGSTSEYIHANNPNLDAATTLQLEHYIDTACTEYQLPCPVFIAILAQESHFDISRINHKTMDYGIGQINLKTIRSLHLDAVRLLTDMQYSVNASARVLSWFHKTYRQESLWYCHYNIGTAPLTNNRLRLCHAYVAKLDL